MKNSKVICILLTLSLFAFSIPNKADAVVAYGFSFPVDDALQSSLDNFGERIYGDIYHLGLDIGKRAGAKVKAAADGVVKHIGEHTRFGYVILVEHNLPSAEKLVSLYGHLRSNVIVREGQIVKRGQIMGEIGNRGENGGWGEHIHFGLRKGAYTSNWVYWGRYNQSELANWYDPQRFIVENQNISDSMKRIISGPGEIGSPRILSFNINGEQNPVRFYGFRKDSRGGADVASADVDGDGKDEIVVGRGPGNSPLVSIYNSRNQKIKEFLVYDKDFRGGVNVSSGDLDQDGSDEIVVAPHSGGGGQVLVYEASGKRLGIDLWPFGPNYKGGIDVAVGNVDSDPKPEIICSALAGGKPEVKIYDYNSQRKIVSNFNAFSEWFKGGVRVAAGDVDLDGIDEIIVGAASRGGHVRVLEPNGAPRGIDYYPFGGDFRDGVDVGALDFTFDRKPEIIISSSGRSTARIKVYRFNYERSILSNFLPYGENFYGGANVAGMTL